MVSREAIPFVALLLAAGRSERMRSAIPKPWIEIRGRSLVEWSALRLARVRGHAGTVLATDEASIAERVPAIDAALRASGVVATVAGGATRQDSCRNAWQAAATVAAGCATVLVHDCARPFFSIEATEHALAAAVVHGGAILGWFARDTLKRTGDAGHISGTIDRRNVFHAATPQVFRTDAFDAMLAHAAQHGTTGTDEAGLAEAAGIRVLAIDSPSTNVKLTYPEDRLLLPALESLLDLEDE